MHRYRKHLLTVLSLTLLFAMVGTASGSRLRSSAHNFRVVWAEMRFRTGEGRVIKCPVTFEGTILSAITKTINAQAGAVTREVDGTCEGGFISLLEETLPWPLLYESFRGTLPNITNILLKLEGFSFTWGPFGFRCLYRVTRETPQPFTLVRNTETWQITDFQPPGSLYAFLDTNCLPHILMSITGSTATTTVQGGGEGVFFSLI